MIKNVCSKSDHIKRLLLWLILLSFNFYQYFHSFLNLYEILSRTLVTFSRWNSLKRSDFQLKCMDQLQTCIEFYLAINFLFTCSRDLESIIKDNQIHFIILIKYNRWILTSMSSTVFVTRC